MNWFSVYLAWLLVTHSGWAQDGSSHPDTFFPNVESPWSWQLGNAIVLSGLLRYGYYKHALFILFPQHVRVLSPMCPSVHACGGLAISSISCLSSVWSIFVLRAHSREGKLNSSCECCVEQHLAVLWIPTNLIRLQALVVQVLDFWCGCTQ